MPSEIAIVSEEPRKYTALIAALEIGRKDKGGKKKKVTDTNRFLLKNGQQ